MRVMVGSRAIIEHDSSYYRQNLDTDYFITSDYIKKYKNNKSKDLINGFYYEYPIEEYVIVNELQEQLYNFIVNDSKTKVIEDTYIPSPEIILSMKLTHRYKKNTPFFKKTLADILWLRKKYQPIKNQLFDDIEKHTLSYGKISLDTNKDGFFKDYDQDSYGHNIDHDSLHEAVKLGKVPAYEYYLKDNEEVLCDKNKWDNCSYTIKISGVIEETAVLALERCLIPNDFNIDPLWAFETSLEKVCTNITSGWFREFAWENYFQIMSIYKTKLGIDFLKKRFDNGLLNNVIKER